jgi:acyl carrier protein
MPQVLGLVRSDLRAGISSSAVVLLQQSQDFCTAPHCGADRLVGWQRIQRRGLIMTSGGLISSDQRTTIKTAFAAKDVRTLVASHLGVSIGSVTDEAHFTDDLGADWLDRLELMIAVENQFAGVEITDGDVDRIGSCRRSDPPH